MRKLKHSFAILLFVTSIFALAGPNDPQSVSGNVSGNTNFSDINPFNNQTTDFGALPNCGWSSMAPLPAGKWAGASTFYTRGAAPNDTGWIYYIGGNDASFFTVQEVNRFNIRTNTWDNAANIPTLKSQITAVTVKNKIYVIGGYGANAFTPTNVNDIYDPLTNTWTTGTPLPVPVGDAAIGVYKDSLIYVIGGYNGSADVNNVQIYNVSSNSWTVGTVKPGTTTAGIRMGIHGNKIVVVAGYSQTLGAPVSEAYVGTIGATAETITWSANIPYPGGTVGRHAGGQVFNSNPNMPYVLFTSGDPNGQGTNVVATTYGLNVNTNEWDLGPVKTTGVSNVNNFVGVKRNDSLFMVCLGGWTGTVVSTANEWLCLGATLTGVSQNGTEVPSKFSLSQNYPNPFNPTTNIKFALPVAGNVELKVYDILGNEVASLVNEFKNAGNYTVDFNASNLASGVYFYTLKTEGFTESKKMLLVK